MNRDQHTDIANQF